MDMTEAARAEALMSVPLNYDGLTFRPVAHPADAGADPGPGVPTGRYRQSGDLVWADFAGGHLRTGRLVGRRDAAGVIDAAYCQIGADGSVVAGQCRSMPTVLPDGRVRLTEHWRRIDGSTGVSQIEQVSDKEISE